MQWGSKEKDIRYGHGGAVRGRTSGMGAVGQQGEGHQVWVQWGSKGKDIRSR